MPDVLELKGVSMSFFKKGRLLEKEQEIKVLRDIDLSIAQGEIVVLVGESGCGKTTLGRIVTGLLKPTRGTLAFDGSSVYGLFARGEDRFRNQVQFIQQDSYAALNPVRTIRQSLTAPIRYRFRDWSGQRIAERIVELMHLVGLRPADQFLDKYPHQLSGGQRQRILMARAVSLEPRLIVADEPVSMIDVSLRLSILDLMADLNRRLDLSFVYITHDLATARYIATNGRICVMYLGEIMEMDTVQSLVANPRHPYTQALFAAVPVPDPAIARKVREIPVTSMDVGNLVTRGDGCPFQPRCPYAVERCALPVPFVEAGTSRVKCSHLEGVPTWEWAG